MNVAEKAYKDGIRHCTLGFSTGKDSVVGFDMLKKAGINVLPIYFYICPDLEFVENNIKIYEDYFQTKIVQLPHPILYDYIRHQDWMSWDKVLHTLQIKFKKYSFEYLTKRYLHSKKLENTYIYDANCMKMSDSLNRRLLLSKNPDICKDKKIIYLAKYHTQKDIDNHCKINNIPVTDDYKYFGRSWDGLSYHFLYGVQKYYPKDYEKIKSMFNLIDAEILRYKVVKKHKI